VGLLFATASLHFRAYGSVVNATPAEAQPLVGAAWVAGGVSLIVSALLAIAATPLFMIRRRALLWISALTPLSIAALQLWYLGFIPPTALLIADGLLLIISGELGRQLQPIPRTTEYQRA
jgi:hypothetical protein